MKGDRVWDVRASNENKPLLSRFAKVFISNAYVIMPDLRRYPRLSDVPSGQLQQCAKCVGDTRLCLLFMVYGEIKWDKLLLVLFISFDCIPTLTPTLN